MVPKPGKSENHLGKFDKILIPWLQRRSRSLNISGTGMGGGEELEMGSSGMQGAKGNLLLNEAKCAGWRG